MLPFTLNRKHPHHHRGFSDSLHNPRARADHEHLLGDPEDEEQHADADGLYPPNSCWTSDHRDPPNPHKDLPVYETIHRIRHDVINSIDDPHSLEQLKAPRMNISVVRPLVDQYHEMQDVSIGRHVSTAKSISTLAPMLMFLLRPIVYCLLVNRCQFIREQSYASHHQTVNLTRALLCELLAEKILRRYNEHNRGPKGLLLLANILVADFDPFQNAAEEMRLNSPHAMSGARQKKPEPMGSKLTALEVAIVSESKSFLASSACQRVVDAIYRGKVVYTPTSFIDIIPDQWKKRPISLYDPRRGPLLNQYRLVVPRIRNVIEVCQFVVLLSLYIVVMAGRESRLTTAYTTWELIFDIYASGWVLDQIASILEHGWQVYSQNLWSFLDIAFSALFAVYLVLRVHGARMSGHHESVLWARTSLDVLSVAAPILIPRLAFNVMSENMLFVSLRAMMSDFMTLTLLAFWSFAGFLLSMKWLHNGAHHTVTIGKWMIWIWFGLDATGIEQSGDFHWFLGPTLMIMFAFLGNTLFLTILVSMLSNTFSMIVSNAVPEIQYRRTVLTFEGVKPDAIFAYFPPFNILALLVLMPLKFFLSPRHFHAVNVAAVRIINLPILLMITWYERRTLWVSDKRRHGRLSSFDWKDPRGPRPAGIGIRARTMKFWDFSRFSVHGDLQAVFDHGPPQSVLPTIAEEDDVDTHSGTGNALLDDSDTQFPDADQTRVKGDNRSPDPKKGGTSNAGRRILGRRVSRTSDALRKEFASSEDEDDDAPDHHEDIRKLTRAERKDSIFDYSDNNNQAIHEANARLYKLEQSTKKIEAMLVQLVDQKSDEAGSGEEELEREVQTGIWK